MCVTAVKSILTFLNLKISKYIQRGLTTRDEHHMRDPFLYGIKRVSFNKPHASRFI